MKRVVLVAAMIAVLLLPGVAIAGSSTDAALALGAFAVFNQVISGTGVFGGTHAVAAPVVAAPAPVYYPPQPVYVAPPPPPVAYYPAPAPVYRAPRVIYVERDRHWQKHGHRHGHGHGHGRRDAHRWERHGR